MKGAIIENNKVHIFRIIRRRKITLQFLVFQCLTSSRRLLFAKMCNQKAFSVFVLRIRSLIKREAISVAFVHLGRFQSGVWESPTQEISNSPSKPLRCLTHQCAHELEGQGTDPCSSEVSSRASVTVHLKLFAFVLRFSSYCETHADSDKFDLLPNSY